jgi:hypothetical protein
MLVAPAFAEDDATPYVPKWAVCGPFANDNGGGFDTAYGPEKEKPLDAKSQYDGLGGKVSWEAAEANDGVLNFLGTSFQNKENVCAYAWVKVKAPKEMSAKLSIGSDDGLKVWLNGAVVHSNAVDRGLTKDEDTVTLKLKAGENDLVCKVTQGGGDWSLAARLLKADAPVGEITFALPPGISATVTAFVKQYLICGPFAGDDNGGYDQVYGPERDVKDLKFDAAYDGKKWREAKANDAGVLNFVDLCADRTENASVYAYVTIKAAKAAEVSLKLGSDDGCKAWLNGKQVHAAPDPRGLGVDQDTVAVKLDAGENKLLVKVVQQGGDWSMCLRIAKAKDGVDGLTFETPKVAK